MFLLLIHRNMEHVFFFFWVGWILKNTFFFLTLITLRDPTQLSCLHTPKKEPETKTPYSFISIRITQLSERKLVMWFLVLVLTLGGRALLFVWVSTDFACNLTWRRSFCDCFGTSCAITITFFLVIYIILIS